MIRALPLPPTSSPYYEQSGTKACSI